MEQLTNQQVFDKVAVHLIAQREAAVDLVTGSCRYRNERDQKCAFGALIPDELYDPDDEGGTALGLLDERTAFRHQLGLDNVSDSLIDALQRAHDTELNKYGFTVWAYQMKFLAASFGLHYDVLREVL